jgi:hypothetical protein
MIAFLLFLLSPLGILTSEIGPIVRITLDEFYIKDSEFIDKIYHRQRLSAIQPLFSKRSMTELESTIGSSFMQAHIYMQGIRNFVSVKK